MTPAERMVFVIGMVCGAGLGIAVVTLVLALLYGGRPA